MLPVPLYSVTDIVILRSLTNLHVGLGRAAEIADLPVQKDEYGFPMVYGSSVKGSMKSLFWRMADESKELSEMISRAIFGPEPGEYGAGETFEAAVAVSDFYLLTMPVRSLKGVYTFITSPILLRRLLLALDFVEKTSNEHLNQDLRNSLEELSKKDIKIDEALGITQDLNKVKIEEVNNRIILCEEFMLEPSEPEALKNHIKILKQAIGLKGSDPLLVVNDDVARELVDRSLIRYTRVRLSRGTKTVERGALWTEEYVPQRTLFFGMFLYKRPPLSGRFIKECLGKDLESYEKDYLKCLNKLNLINEKEQDELSKLFNDKLREFDKRLAEKVREKVWATLAGGQQDLSGYLILGGKESIGKGIVRLEVLGCGGKQ